MYILSQQDADAKLAYALGQCPSCGVTFEYFAHIFTDADGIEDAVECQQCPSCGERVTG